VTLCGLAGCQDGPALKDTFETGPAVARAEAAPSYLTMATLYNPRVAHLNPFWARADLALDHVEDGKLERDHAEATIQFRLPREFNFIIQKVSEDYFILGCDKERYWWFDRKAKPPTVVIGRHASATREKIAMLGVPVLPLEIVDVLGVSPLPVTGVLPTARWSPLKNWVVFSLPAPNTPGGTIEYWLEPRSSDPARIRILDDKKNELIDCRTEKLGLVKVGSRLDEGTRIASKVRISVPERQTVMILEMNAMENRALTTSKAFDLGTLKAAYPSDREIDLDTVVINRDAGPGKGSK
jgi:hypothetical protein